MTGRNKYLPKIVIEEIDDIKLEHHIKSDSDAMTKMVDYTRVGRELERISRFDLFGRMPTKKKGRQKRKGGLLLDL